MNSLERPRNKQLDVLEQIRDGIAALVDQGGGGGGGGGNVVASQGDPGDQPWPVNVENSPVSSAPAGAAFTIVPSDDQVFPEPTRAIWVGVEGDLVVEMEEGGVVTFQNVYVGWHPIRVVAVKAATSAQGIVGVY